MERFRPAQVVADDTRLAEDLRAGHEDALRTLYARFGGLVFTVVLRLVGDRHLAEDVTQQVFVQAWRHIDRFEVGRDFAPWLATIARRAAIDALRAAGRRPAVPVAAVDDAADAGVGTIEVEVVWEVRAAIDALDATERDVVRLQHLEGLTHEQIAARLEVPIGTVKSRSHRAHRRLATLLGHLGPGGGGTNSAGTVEEATS